MNLSRTIRSARESAGLSQAEFAKMVGVSPGTVADWELGRQGPRWKNIRRIAKVTGVAIAELVA